MTQTIADGPYGLEARHRLTPPIGAALLMNDWSAVPGIHFDKMPNFNSLPDVEDNRQGRVGRIGENPLPTQERGKTFTTIGRLVATSAQQLRQLESSVKQAFGASREVEATWRIEPDVSVAIAGKYWEGHLRVIDWDPDEEFVFSPQSRLGPYQLNFTSAFRMSDPRWLWSDTQDSGVSSANPTVVTNSGNAPTEPSLAIHVPAGNDWFTVTNDTTGAVLGMDLPGFIGLAGGTALFDFTLRTAGYLVDGGTYPDDVFDITWLINFGSSTWWWPSARGLVPGVNSISLQNCDTIQIIYKHASW